MGRDSEPEPEPANELLIRPEIEARIEARIGPEIEALAAAIRRCMRPPVASTEALRPEAFAASLGLRVVSTDHRSASLFPGTLAIPREMEPRRAGEAISELAARALALRLAERLARAVLIPEDRLRAALEEPSSGGASMRAPAKEPMQALRAAFPEVTERQLRARLRELGLPVPTLIGLGPR